MNKEQSTPSIFILICPIGMRPSPRNTQRTNQKVLNKYLLRCTPTELVCSFLQNLFQFVFTATSYSPLELSFAVSSYLPHHKLAGESTCSKHYDGKFSVRTGHVLLFVLKVITRRGRLVMNNVVAVHHGTMFSTWRPSGIVNFEET